MFVLFPRYKSSQSFCKRLRKVVWNIMEPLSGFNPIPLKYTKISFLHHHHPKYVEKQKRGGSKHYEPINFGGLKTSSTSYDLRLGYQAMTRLRIQVLLESPKLLDPNSSRDTISLSCSRDTTFCQSQSPIKWWSANASFHWGKHHVRYI